MKLYSWNVNGLRAVMKKDFNTFIETHQPDVLCLQELKLQEDQVPEDFVHHSHWENAWHQYHFAEKKGYSGSSIHSRIKPLSRFSGIGHEEYDCEGRVSGMEFNDFYLLSVYFPNSQHELKRLDYRLDFNDKLLAFCEKLRKKKPVMICGDFNVAHEEIDLKNPKTNKKNPGFYIDEREWFTKLLAAGYRDIFRDGHPSEEGHYTWWSYRAGARQRNVGWRIDYFVVDQNYKGKTEGKIHSDITGSDHCPVSLHL